MQKNIIVLMDGTWDNLDDKALSNVAKLKDLLIQDNTRQIVYYDDGVGANELGVSKLIDGATGLGIDDKVIQGYQFIMQNFNSNDNICLLGFSRGAYTVRYIADFIAHMGLLKIQDNETSSQQFQRINNYFNQYKQIRYAADTQINLAIANPCIINMVGVWDTVGALGIPFSAFAQFNKELYEFQDNTLHNNVLNGYQALAIDEKRQDFQPSLWGARTGVTQIWFSGVHADIGGGYTECGLSDITLSWMIKIITDEHSVLINNAQLKNINPDPLAKLHDSSNSFPYDVLPNQIRVIPINSFINNSVKIRMADTALNYKPINLPTSYTWC